MKHTLGVLTLLLVLAAGLMPVSASVPEQTNAPLVFVMNGDLWKWSVGNSQPTRMTEWGYNFRPVISPDETRVAYKSWAQLSVDYINVQGFAWAGDMPGNIWVMDVNTGEAVRVADQPAGATLESGAIHRSDPTWSPDGNALAWVELVNAGTGALQLVTYNFSTGTSQNIVQPLPYPFMDAGIYLQPVKWGMGGISYNIFTYSETAQTFVQILYVYQPDGTLTSSTEISISPENFIIEDFWFGKNIGLVSTSGGVSDLNTVTGTISSANGFPYLQAGGGVTANALQMIPAPTDGTYNINWFVIDNALNVVGQIPYFGTTNFGGITPGPDGVSFAYITDALYIWSAGQITQVPGTEGILESNFGWGAGVVWAYESWGLQSGGAGEQPAPEISTCPGNVQPRLLIGQQGRVIPGLGTNVLRTEPRKGASSPIIDNIPEGGLFSVLKGPVCSDNINWWLVDYNGTVGWTGESEGQTYWAEPVTTNTAACNLLPRLAINSTGTVLPGLPNVLRTQPYTGSASAIIGRIPAGGTFTVLEGPVCGNSYYWWLVDYNGTVGWTAEGEGNTYWLEPR